MHTQFVPTDTEYISMEELAKVDKMLSHLSEESKQAAATTLVSAPPPSPARSHTWQQPQCPAQLPWDTVFLLLLLTASCPPNSPPARKTCAPSATHTPSQPSSDPAPTSHASE